VAQLEAWLSGQRTALVPAAVLQPEATVALLEPATAQPIASPPAAQVPTMAPTPTPLVSPDAVPPAEPAPVVSETGVGRGISVAGPLNRRALLFVGVIVVLALGWVGMSALRTNDVPGPPPIEAVRDPGFEIPASTPPLPPRDAASVVSSEPPPSPAGADAAVSPSDVHEEIPDVPLRARQTIRGTVRVSVRVIVNNDGTVFAALTDEPGPSRYFERLAVDASKKWTFSPVDAENERLMLLRFEFTREGTTARAVTLQ
jgi:TonB family protein